MAEDPHKVEFRFDRLPTYRTYFVDGAHGGVTTQGNIYADLFVEKISTPERQVLERNEDGSYSQTSVVGDSAMVRQVECGLIFDLRSAIGFRNWLDEKIERMTSIIEQLEAKQ